MAEVSRPNFRGAFGNSLSLSVAIGITLAMVLGALMNWRTLAISLSIIPLLGIHKHIQVQFHPKCLIFR